MATVPTRCLTERITKNTVYLRGVAISLVEIQRETKLTYSYVSKIFSGTRKPRTATSRFIAHVLGMDLVSFLDAIEERAIDLRGVI